MRRAAKTEERCDVPVVTVVLVDLGISDNADLGAVRDGVDSLEGRGGVDVLGELLESDAEDVQVPLVGQELAIDEGDREGRGRGEADVAAGSGGDDGVAGRQEVASGRDGDTRSRPVTVEVHDFPVGAVTTGALVSPVLVDGVVLGDAVERPGVQRILGHLETRRVSISPSQNLGGMKAYRSGLVDCVLADSGGLDGGVAVKVIVGVGGVDRPDRGNGDVVSKVGTDGRVVDAGLDAELVEVSWVADTGELEDHRGVDRASRQDDLLVGRDGVDGSYWRENGA